MAEPAGAGLRYRLLETIRLFAEALVTAAYVAPFIRHHRPRSFNLSGGRGAGKPAVYGLSG